MHQTYVDVDVMARHLQEKYRDYGRRKIQVFRSLVDQGDYSIKTILFKAVLLINCVFK